MIKKIIIILAALAAGSWLAAQGAKESGYVLLKFGDWSIETSVIVLVIALLILFTLLYMLLRSWGVLRRSPKEVGKWNDDRKQQKSRKALTKGLISLEEGKFAEAEHLLLRHASNSDTPLLHYLGAARAAQSQDASERRDNYLRLARETTDKAEVAVGLVQSELQLAAGQKEQAIAGLKYLREAAPKHPQVLKNLQQIYADSDEWEDMQDMLPDLRKRHVLPSAEMKELAGDATAGQLHHALAQKDWDMMSSIWRDAPTKLRQTETLLMPYLKGLEQQDQQQQALQLIESFMRKNWSDSLAYLYGKIEMDDSLSQLAKTEKWLKKETDNPWLLLSAGRLARKNQLWAKAEDYLRSSLAKGPRGETYQELAQVLTAEGKADEAAEMYQLGLSMMVTDESQIG